MPLPYPVRASPSFCGRSERDRAPQNVVRGHRATGRPQVDECAPNTPVQRAACCLDRSSMNRVIASGPGVSARNRGLSATRGMEPAHYDSVRASEKLAGIVGSWVGAVACPRPHLVVTVVGG